MACLGGSLALARSLSLAVCLPLSASLSTLLHHPHHCLFSHPFFAKKTETTSTSPSQKHPARGKANQKKEVGRLKRVKGLIWGWGRRGGGSKGGRRRGFVFTMHDVLFFFCLDFLLFCFCFSTKGVLGRWSRVGDTFFEKRKMKNGEGGRLVASLTAGGRVVFVILVVVSLSSC